MKRLFLISILFILLFNSCSVLKFARYYASADSSPGVLRDRVYQTKDTSYQIGELNDGWRRIDIKGGDLAFWNDALGATITVNSTCQKDNKEVKYSLKALSESLVVGIKDKQLVLRKEMLVNGEQTLESVYLGKVNEVPIKMSAVVLKKKHCYYDLTYASSPDSFAGGLDGFMEFVLNFRLF